MDAETPLVETIAAFCDRHGIAETTFGRLAVNDGKFVARARAGGRVEPATLARVSAFMEAAERGEIALRGRARRQRAVSTAEALADIQARETAIRTASSFEFHEQRMRYHVFANTTNEAWVLADRAIEELAAVRIAQPGLRLFYAPMDNGTALNRILRWVHKHNPNVPVLVTVKGRGLEDLRNTLGKMVDRIAEHPNVVLALTNMYIAEALDLRKSSADTPADVIWREVALEGGHSYDFMEQVSRLYGALAAEWQVRAGAQRQPVYARPSVLVLYRADHRFLLDRLIPRPGDGTREHDFVLLAHAFLHSHPMAFRIGHVLGPACRHLAPGGRAMVVQSHGEDPAHDIVRRVWPDRPLPQVSRYDIIRELRRELAGGARRYAFHGLTDRRALFRFDMHTLPVLPGEEIGAPTLTAAWNNAVYFAQVRETLAQDAMLAGPAWAEATRAVLAAHGGLWFVNEMFTVLRTG